MRKFAIAAVAVLAIAGSTAVYAQHRHWGYGHSRMNPEDRAAFADARIAAVHAGLKLTPDQEKLWPPVEAARSPLQERLPPHRRASQKPQDRPRGGRPYDHHPRLLRPARRRDPLPAEAE